ncbi:DUF5672 family protein [Sphingomonas sp. BN140010]|uniref:DUF5672 family protein n=1 Tax=Sphingomonas arvum TaxID=2992113 RepID=A0ABT3JC65_9SPHN|nr:DUF5672 family protein [Sphingomonas sp. BN140010]MCW3796667.1 DUF5672 family protein [Sphingomonas sp. BN140010]
MASLYLPTVTLAAVTSVNVEATIAALKVCLDAASFGDAILLTDAEVEPPSPVRHVRTDPILTSSAYSEFMLTQLVDHVRTEHVLVVQWDGFIASPGAWDERFLDYDYIGAPWPQFSDGYDVGNGGFSLRSRRLLEACRDSEFRVVHPEDVAICRTNRAFLEEKHRIRFADAQIAGRFSKERNPSLKPTFGVHGIFNLVEALGPERFWELYSSLDERRGVVRDRSLLFRQLRSARGGVRRSLQLWLGLLGDRVRMVVREGT